MKRDLIAFIMSVGLIVVGIYVIMQSNLKEVNIKDNGELITLTTYQQVVGDVLQEALVRVGNFDELNVGLDEEVYDGMQIEIIRAKPIVINDGGLRSRLYVTTTSTVNDILEKRDIDLNDADEVSVLLTDFVEEGMEIGITRIGFEYETVTEQANLETQYVETDTLRLGVERVHQQGSPRIIERVLQHTYENGERVSTGEVQQNIVDAGTARIIHVGTFEPPTTASGHEILSTFTANMTAYYATCAGCTGRVACNGRDVTSNIFFPDSEFGNVRIIAADRSFPCGTIMEISGVGPAIVLDRGGKVVGNVVDLLMDSGARSFGRQNIETNVLRLGW
ncbi:MAG: G5 domain-containing protein [Turicibacter sp.]|nr:G5 domain-containing protein [Turicibacter sp.]